MDEKVEKVLRRIERENEAEKVWIVGPETGQVLYDLVREVGPRVALEIGTSVGYSAIWIASALRDSEVDGASLGAKLWTVESHAERFARAEGNIAEVGLDGVIMQVKGHAPEVFSQGPSMPEELGFAFFDATKNEHVSYFEAVFPLMQPGGMIVVDNVISHAEEMAEFLDMLKNHEKLECELVRVGSGLLVCRVL